MSSLQLKGMLVIGLAISALLAGPASATNVTVDCSGSNHNAYPSINAALATLDLVGPHTITVTGPCHENVSITQRDRLTIQGAAGQFAKIQNAANPASITLYIAGSHNIVLDHLIIQGGSIALYVSVGSSVVNIQNCLVMGSLSDGLDVDQSSTLIIQNSSFEKNARSGIFISNQSQITFGTYPSQRTYITQNGFGNSGNGSNGLKIDGSEVQLNFGVLTVAGNHGAGIQMEGGRLQMYGGAANTPPGIIENNSTGLQMNDSASATLWGAFLIRNNGSTGISVNGSSSITFFSTVDSQGKDAVTSVSGHSTVGLTLSQSSAAQIYGPHLIQGNGNANANPGSRGGISLEGSSLTIGGGTSVSSNVGPGVRLGVKSDLIMFDSTVSNNTEEGVRETNLSAGGFYNPLIFVGNGGASLYCDSLSLAFGDASTVQGANCRNITTATGPGPAVHASGAR